MSCSTRSCFDLLCMPLLLKQANKRSTVRQKFWVIHLMTCRIYHQRRYDLPVSRGKFTASRAVSHLSVSSRSKVCRLSGRKYGNIRVIKWIPMRFCLHLIGVLCSACNNKFIHRFFSNEDWLISLDGVPVFFLHLRLRHYCSRILPGKKHLMIQYSLPTWAKRNATFLKLLTLGGPLHARGRYHCI